MAENRTTRTIAGFKGALAGGGARPNLFEVDIKFPSGVSGDQTQFQFMCKAAAMPAQNVASIDVPFRGRIFKVAGDRTIDNWTVTIINQEDFQLRQAFESWSELMAKLSNNSGATSPNAYMSKGTVYQLGRGASAKSEAPGGDSVVLKTYTFEDIFPVTVGEIALSYDTGDTIEEFDVEFAVNNISLVAPTATSSDNQ